MWRQSILAHTALCPRVEKTYFYFVVDMKRNHFPNHTAATTHMASIQPEILPESDVNTMTSPADIHCWVRLPDGSVHDPEFKNYKTIRDINGCSEQKVLQPFTSATQENLWKRVLVPQISKQIMATRAPESFLDEIYARPVFGYCYTNAFAYVTNKNTPPGADLVIGRCGWRSKRDPSVIHWEYG